MEIAPRSDRIHGHSIGSMFRRTGDQSDQRPTETSCDQRLHVLDWAASAAATISRGFSARSRHRFLGCQRSFRGFDWGCRYDLARTMVPLSAFARFEPGPTPLSVDHQGQFGATTISFNLAPGDRSAKPRRISTIRSSASACLRRSTAPSPAPAATFQRIAIEHAASVRRHLVTIYIVLGIFYEA